MMMLLLSFPVFFNFTREALISTLSGNLSRWGGFPLFGETHDFKYFNA